MAEYRTDQYRAAFRATLRPDYESISDEQADALLESVTAGMSAQEADAYMEGLGSWFKKALHTVASTAPIWAPIAGAAIGSIVPGVGTAIGGAVGGLAGNVAGRLAANPRANAGSLIGAGVQGAVAGGLGGRAGGGQASVAAGLVGSALGGGGQAAGRGGTGAGLASAAMGLVGSALSGGSQASPAAPASPRPAATQLMSFLNNPHFNRAVLGQITGQLGRPSVPVPAGGRTHDVAFGSFINALVHLAQQAATEAPAHESGSTSYLTDSEGAYAYDPASPEQRAEGLLDLLNKSFEESGLPDEQTEAPAEADGYDALTEWFLNSGLIRR